MPHRSSALPSRLRPRLRLRSRRRTHRTGCDGIDADTSSTVSGDGQGSVPINVAVLDTGIDVDHPDLNVVGGKDCSSAKGFDDADGHGTMVAGFIGALDNSIGRVGVAPSARLWSVRLIDRNGHYADRRLICALDFVAGTHADADPSNDIAVANMSLSGKNHDDADCATTKNAIHVALCGMIDSGVVPVAAAGNSSQDLALEFPGAWNEVLTVTAMADFDGEPGGLAAPIGPECRDEQDDTEAFFSNFATLPEDEAHTVSAPGVCIGSTYRDGLYAIGSGTSFATPLVAGTVALCISSGPCAGLTPAQVIDKVVADAAAYNLANPGYGFQGDPLRPVPGKYYGYLIRAGLY